MNQNCLNFKLKYSELIKLQQELNLVVLENKDSKQGKRIEKQIISILEMVVDDDPFNLFVDKKISKIKEKLQNNQPLLKRELLFIYQIKPERALNDNRQKELENIIQGRDIKKEVALLLNCSEDQVTTTEEEALKGNIKYHYGDLYLDSLTSAEGLKLPEIVNGELNLSSLTSAEGLKLPEIVNGALDLEYLESAKGLKFPRTLNGTLWLSSLKSAEGLELPEIIMGSLNLSNLESAVGFKPPLIIHRSFYLESLTSAEGLKLPMIIREEVALNSLPDDEKNKFRKARPDLRII